MNNLLIPNNIKGTKMDVNFIVSFKHHPQVMFDIELETHRFNYEQMRFQIQFAAYCCLFENGFNVDDVWKISTAANWTDTWCKEHGPLPSDFKSHFNGKFVYGEYRKDNLSLEGVIEAQYTTFKKCAFHPMLANVVKSKETMPFLLS